MTFICRAISSGPPHESWVYYIATRPQRGVVVQWEGRGVNVRRVR